ncbi:MAG: Spy/CpxP family protein refolding chaperone [Myxococcota bacterium]|nr:Spy/CpxP family protein refolding chaperone [Myxococcota bacterium]
MKLSNNKGLALSCVLAGLLVGGTALAKAPGKGCHGKEGRHSNPVELVSELGVSDAVIKEVKALHRASRDARLEMKFKLDQARNALRDLLDADAPSESSVMAQVDTVGVLRTQLKKARLRTRLQIRALLTPAQRTKFRKLKRQKRGKLKGCGADKYPGPKD